MSENRQNGNPKAQVSNVLFCPQPKDIQFTVIEEERKEEKEEKKYFFS